MVIARPYQKLYFKPNYSGLIACRLHEATDFDINRTLILVYLDGGCYFCV